MNAALLLDKHPNVPTNRMHETSESLRGVLSARARSALFAIHSLDHRASWVEHLDVHARSFCESHRRFLRFGRDRLGNRAPLVHSERRTAVADAIPLVADVGYSVRRSFARSAAFSLFATTRARSENHLNFTQ